MLEIGWILYSIIALLAWRPLSGHFAWVFLAQGKRAYSGLYRNTSKPTGEHWLCGIIVGALGAAFWPIAILMTAAGTDRFAVGAEKEAKLLETKKKLKELEQELGV